MTRIRAASLALLVAAAPVLAGCSDPYADPTPASPTQAAHAGPRDASHDDADRQTDRGDPDVLRTENATEAGDAEIVARDYARAAGTWSWKTYRAQYARLRALAGGDLARQLAATPADEDVLRGLAAQRQTNRARILATDSRPVHPGRREVIVVLSETTGSKGMRDTLVRHNVYHATLRRTDRGWKVTAWRLLP